MRRSATLLRRAFGIYFGAAPWAAAVGVVIMVVGGLTAVATAWFTRAVIDGLSAGERQTIWLGVVGFGALAIVTPVVLHVSEYAQRDAERRVTIRTQQELFSAVSAHPRLTELEDSRFHDRLRLAHEASRFAPTQLNSMILGIGQALITIAAFGVTLVRWSPMVSALVMLAVLPTLVAQIRLARMRGAMLERTVPMFRRQTFYASLLLDMRAAKEIRLFGLGAFFQGRLLRELRAAQAQERHQDRLALWVDSALAALTGIVSLVALAVFVARVADGHGSVGDLVVVIAALAALQTSASSLVRQIAMLGETMIVFGHYVDITAVIGEARRAVALPTVPPLRQGVEFDDVWFRYAPDHDWVLRGLTMRIPRGSSLALVGDNGAGKSTVVKLLCGFYVPVRGVIRWDGVDISTIDPASLRARLGATFQDFMTYEFSAHDNIAVGDLSALDDRARVRAAASTADLDSTLDALPNGYDTMLTRAYSDGDVPGVGVVLSGGQWQRLALARAALREGADMLILDEPSSGLDVATEHEINRRLMALRRTHTSLLISHRLNTVREADSIAVLSGGRILEQGSHDELMASGGRYADLFHLQASGYHDTVTTRTSM
ncbi:ABC transporter ATP-binding protein [Micromonospora sp. CA-249363]|uniref:ABC transporter ATP-binding protein n=1 Tax=Micromonospora sp. CA-249363 TaxID=3239963 RepID=UPI003D941CDD